MVKESVRPSVVGIVPAGGRGERVGLGPKAFLKPNGKSLLQRVISTLSGTVDRILVGVPSDYLKKAEEDVGKIAEVYPGGRSRQETIKLLFQRTKEEIIVIHDVARPFASRQLLRKVIEGAYRFDACGIFIHSHLPVFLFEGDFITSSIPAKQILLPQSPQAFRRKILEKAFEFADEHGIEEQTLYELLLKIGINTYVVKGEETNIKITTRLDWEIAKRVIVPSIDYENKEDGD